MYDANISNEKFDTIFAMQQKFGTNEPLSQSL